MQTVEERNAEATLSALLVQFRAATDEIRASEIEREIMPILARYLQLSLRPVMASMLGPEMSRKGKGDSRGFTVLLNNFFVKLLASGPDELWRLETARDLRMWAARVMVNLFIDHHRQKRRRQEILRDGIGPLYEIRKRHFEKSFPEGFDKFIDMLDVKEKLSELPDEERRLLELHYLVGMSWREDREDDVRWQDEGRLQETAEQLGMSKSTFFRVKANAIKRLCELLSVPYPPHGRRNRHER
jgi:RNA polymerase sigma factor (sigma-70 family)